MSLRAALVIRAAWLLLAVIAFSMLATANAGGYRFGASDQAFYIPAVALRADDSLLSRDREVFEPQMRLWLGDEALAGVVRTTGIGLPSLFALLQALTLATRVRWLWLAAVNTSVAVMPAALSAHCTI